MFVEVKHLDPNDEDRRMVAEQERFGRWSGGHPSGRRARKKIAEGMTKFQEEHRKFPCIIVLYDNTIVDGRRPLPPDFHLDRFEVDVAMYGWLSKIVTFHGDHVSEREEMDRWSRKLTREFGTRISAVCVLFDSVYTGEPFVIAYHNYFATHPLPVSIFSGPGDCNFVKPNEPEECKEGVWVRAERS